MAIHDTVENIRASQWNALLRANDLPFLEWEWYAALESSGSISAETGWHAVHVVVNKGAHVVGIAPLYIKMHSWGELVFDHEWQRVARGVGADYFPKLVGMVPVTPCSGYKFLISAQEDGRTITEIIMYGIAELIRQQNIQTVAFNFVDYNWACQLEKFGYHVWAHSGFSWHNDGFASFAAYTGCFNKNQRRNIRREREALGTAGMACEVLRGQDIPREYFDTVYQYYLATNQKFGPFAAHFLNKDFFGQIATRYAHRILLCCCFRQQDVARPHNTRTAIAMAMFIHKNEALYGRYWGSADTAAMLHFNVCYYTPIEWAIAHKYRYFDPGIGGDHKLRRGFRADMRYSALYFVDPRMQGVLAHNYAEINSSLEVHVAQLNKERPLLS